ncbi:formylglycine-generating enzyme family protein [Streptomyces sp. MRC013]|uniref:formylglycine-generating enzyme family protein n=1 Tax=Streptomyces sp. MRC013 TaxID=2898276 RepID=UPI0020264AD0|nr:SUMF1/EgtB/PvdO family nonheme iron enzyme [Streptomyces sp. MRC013]URM88782.1 formylglycine-generating enzyme family protein [Streptomyces sp. MRC013]
MDGCANEEMAAVPGGRVAPADRLTGRGRPVDVAPYLLGTVPVTREWYARVTGERPGDGGAGTGRLPAEGVSWWDAVRFCDVLSRREGLAPAYRVDGDRVEWDASADGYRLPTEAEWEHACRAGTGGQRYGPLDEVAWHRGNSGGRPRPVGGRRPNDWGLYDMLGNVWEWCWDAYDAGAYGAYRVLRGGGWFDEHWNCRAPVRRRGHPTYRGGDVGFRVARSHPAPAHGAA